MSRLRINLTTKITEEFERFILFKTSEGLADKTIRTYQNHFQYWSKYIEVDRPLSELKKEDIQNAITQMRE